MHTRQIAPGANAARHSRPRPGLLGAIALGAAFLPAAGYAASWEYIPTVSTGIAYQTNPEYLDDRLNADDAYSGFVDMLVDISRETGRSQFSVRPRSRVTVYTGADNSGDLNTDDYYLPVRAIWADPRLQYGFNLGFSQIANREVTLTDPNVPASPDSAPNTVDENQDRWYAAPFASFQVTPRDLAETTLSFDRVSYDTDRPNYTYGNLTASWTHSLDRKSRISGSVNLNNFRATQPGRKNETIGYGFDAGYQYSLSDLTTIGLKAGASRSDITLTTLNRLPYQLLPCFDPEQQEFPPSCELQSNDNNFVGELFFREKVASTITTDLSVSRSITPSSDGAQVTQDLARAYVSKELTERWSAGAGVTYISQAAVGAKSGGLVGRRFDTNYLQGELSVSWRLTRTLSLDGRYNYYSDEQRSSSSFSFTTTNQLVSLQLRYAGLGTH